MVSCDRSNEKVKFFKSNHNISLSGLMMITRKRLLCLQYPAAFTCGMMMKRLAFLVSLLASFMPSLQGDEKNGCTHRG